MNDVITDTKNCRVSVSALQKDKMVAIYCEEFYPQVTEDIVVLLSKEEVEGVILALQKSLSLWEE